MEVGDFVVKFHVQVIDSREGSLGLSRNNSAITQKNGAIGGFLWANPIVPPRLRRTLGAGKWGILGF